MIRITFISPYAALTGEIDAAFRQLGRPDIQYKILNIAQGEEELNGEIEGDVFIARGFALRYFQDKNPWKMLGVEISTTGFDLVMAVNECIRTYGCRHLAILGTESMLYGAQNFGSLFEGVQIDHYLTEDREGLERCIDRAVQKGAQAIIGGQTACRKAKKRGLPFTMVRTGREAIMKALEMSIRLVEATRQERQERDRLAKIMDYSYSGILSTDREGTIRSINPKACAIVRLSEQDALGQPVQKLFPGLDIQQVVRKNEKLVDEICQIQGQVITLNCVPIEGTRESSGVVITCTEARELQKTEAKIRRNILQKGFVAKYTFADIIHQDAVMCQTIEKARRFSRNESNVLLYGETGVGKELFAQSIHNASRRAKGPFVAINCAALPEHLLESELFGYVEGAFTGASKNGKIGLFEAAHNGTIFLDEIGDLSSKLQGRLLRVIQEREIVRLGGDHVIPIDVRIISATNKNLNDEQEAGNFRRDLMYRLEVLKLRIPPLNQRKGDIIPLVWRFLEEGCQKEHKPLFTRLDPEAELWLQTFSWQGNVRQLRNVVERICVLCNDQVISCKTVVEALELGDEPLSRQPPAKGLWLEQTERERLIRALSQVCYRKGEAAKLLGIDRSTLWRRMKKYGLD
ncbi:MAG: sigma 54-interacting transcriptional regulator [Anaerotruncus sp.]|nr:sigma 54-interacting transcriptional regulator [Anaerotruncus sp.]